MGLGPTVAGEPTRRYRAVNERAGEGITEAQERLARVSAECAELLAPVKDAWKDWTTSLEVVIGEESQRVYSVTVEASGSDMARRTEIEVDQYNERVEIEPPAGAEELPQRTDAPGPCD